MTCSSLAIPLQSGELYHALFMLRYAFLTSMKTRKQYGNNMDRKSCNQNLWVNVLIKQTSSRVCLLFPHFSKDIISRLRYCSKGDPNYLLNYLVNNQIEVITALRHVIRCKLVCRFECCSTIVGSIWNRAWIDPCVEMDCTKTSMRENWLRKSRKIYDLAACSPGMTVDGHSRLLIQINIEFHGHDKCSMFLN